MQDRVTLVKEKTDHCSVSERHADKIVQPCDENRPWFIPKDQIYLNNS